MPSPNSPKTFRREFSPQERGCPECGAELRVAETNSRSLTSLWGKVKALRCRYRCRKCSYSHSAWLDDSLDESGCLPEVLARAHDATTLLSYRQASSLLGKWGLNLSKSGLCNLSTKLNDSSHQQGTQQLLALAERPLAAPVLSTKRWVIECDGKFVPIWSEAKLLEWREVKSAVLYPMKSPGERYYLSHLGNAESFSARVHGLLRHAGVTQQDQVLGVSDGALWIAELMGDLGVHRHILDVYHTSTYLETLMHALGWTEAERETERRSLLRGEIDVQSWLNLYLPSQLDTAELDESAQKALAYLTKQALLGHTCYPEFRAEGIEVIGSGQIEGANKSVIGGRLNISGAHWRETGGRGMAFVRGEYFSHRPVTDFHTIRQQAFSSLKAA